MSQTAFEQELARINSLSGLELALEGIDRELDYLHKHAWAQEQALLERAAGRATGPDKEAAEQAARDHLDLRWRPETSREKLRQQVIANFAARDKAP